jgi:GMP synthase (glutamine-hydrolysing)
VHPHGQIVVAVLPDLYPHTVIGPRLLVVQHNLDDSMNDLAGPLAQARLHIDPWCTYVTDEPPAPIATYDGVLTMGALASVSHEAEHVWMQNERRVLEHALQARIPVLGVCFGAQLLAAAGGAEFRRAPAEAIGWCTVDMEPEAGDDPLFAGLGAQFHAFQYHYDTFTEPKDSVILGRAGEIIEAYRIGDHAWGVQFHIEANPAVVYAWLGTYRKEMDHAGVDIEAMRELTATYAAEYRRKALALSTAFAAQVSGYAQRRR